MALDQTLNQFPADVNNNPVAVLATYAGGVVSAVNSDESGNLNVYDTTLESLFGTRSLVNNDRLRVTVDFEDNQTIGRIGASNECLGINCKGKQSVLVHISGTWAGTISFEARGDAGNWTAINGMATNGSTILSSTTGNGVYRFNTSGHVRFQVRFSTYTSGTALITLIATAELAALQVASHAIGSQSQALNQRATTFELNTYDTYMAGTLTSPTIAPAKIAPSAVVQPSTYVSNFLGSFPQIYPRVRVEAGGDQRLPFAQDPLSKALICKNDDVTRLLEAILLQVSMTTQILMQANNISPPNGWQEIK